MFGKYKFSWYFPSEQQVLEWLQQPVCEPLIYLMQVLEEAIEQDRKPALVLALLQVMVLLLLLVWDAVRVVVVLILIMGRMYRKQKNQKIGTDFEWARKYFPEECVAELAAKHQRLIAHQHLSLIIRFIILCDILELVWAFYLQICIENIWLPQRSSKQVDD